MNKKLENEQYVCICGNTQFGIFHTYLECSKCGNKYNYYSGYLYEPKVFNGRRTSLLKKEK